MKSAERAKQRLQADVMKKLEPYREVLASADMQCDLEREIQALKKERDTIQQQLVEAQASAANWKYQYSELLKRYDELSEGNAELRADVGQESHLVTEAVKRQKLRAELVKQNEVLRERNARILEELVQIPFPGAERKDK